MCSVRKQVRESMSRERARPGRRRARKTRRPRPVFTPPRPPMRDVFVCGVARKRRNFKLRKPEQACSVIVLLFLFLC